MEQKVAPLIVDALSETLRVKFSAVVKRHAELDCTVGVMLHALYSIYSGLPEKSDAITQCVTQPKMPSSASEPSNCLRDWIEKVEVCKSLMSAVPDYDSLSRTLDRLAKSVDEFCSEFAFERMMWAREHKIGVLGRCDQSLFFAYISHAQSLLDRVNVSSGVARAGKGPGDHVDGDEPSPGNGKGGGRGNRQACHFFVKGRCKGGKSCQFYHDCDVKKLGKMCFVCGSRGPEYHAKDQCPIVKQQKEAAAVARQSVIDGVPSGAVPVTQEVLDKAIAKGMSSVIASKGNE